MLSGRSGNHVLSSSPDCIVDPKDRGLAYADGVFETCAVIGGRICLWSRHLQRLNAACERLRIPNCDGAKLYNDALRVVDEAPYAALKIIVTRGVGGRGYRIPKKAVPNWLLQVSDWSYETYALQSAIAVRVCRTAAPISPALAGLKHLGRLENVLARSEWSDDRIYEGLMLDTNGFVIEATQSNVFIECQGRMITPSLSQSGVAGVVRGLVLDCASALGSPVLEKSITLNDVISADALYVTNSLIGVRRVGSVDGHQYSLAYPVNSTMEFVLQRAFVTET